MPKETKKPFFAQYPKKILIFCGLIIIIFLLALALFWRGKILKSSQPQVKRMATLVLEPKEGSFKAGAEFKVKIIVDTGDYETDATDVRLSYNPQIVSVTKIAEGKIYDNYPAKRIDTVTGVVVINGITGPSNTFKGKDVFATLNLKGLKKGKLILTLEFNPEATNDCNVVATKIAKDVLREVEGGVYEIQ